MPVSTTAILTPSPSAPVRRWSASASMSDGLSFVLSVYVRLGYTLLTNGIRTRRGRSRVRTFTVMPSRRIWKRRDSRTLGIACLNWAAAVFWRRCSLARYAREDPVDTSRRCEVPAFALSAKTAASGGWRSRTMTRTRPCAWPCGTWIVPARRRGSETSPKSRRIGCKEAAVDETAVSAATRAMTETRRRKALRLAQRKDAKTLDRARAAPASTCARVGSGGVGVRFWGDQLLEE